MTVTMDRSALAAGQMRRRCGDRTADGATLYAVIADYTALFTSRTGRLVTAAVNG